MFRFLKKTKKHQTFAKVDEYSLQCDVDIVEKLNKKALCFQPNARKRDLRIITCTCRVVLLWKLNAINP